MPRYFAALLGLFLALEKDVSYGFLHTTTTTQRRCFHAATTTPLLMSASTLPSAEESVRALQDYMARAHEEKLKAIEAAEAKNKAEIQSLRQELEKFQQSRGSSSMELASASEDTRELSEQLAAYQRFMSEYIVKAQEEKLIAVKTAEAAAKNKYEEKLQMLGAISTTSSSSPPPPTAAKPAISANQPDVKLVSPSNPTKLYTERSAKVAAAARAGKQTRWGDAEVSKAESISSVPETEKNGSVQPSEEIIAADHGLHREGDLSLAERVLLGAQAASGGESSPATSVQSNSLYHKRNVRLAEAAKAGKNGRWGDMEVGKINKLVQSGGSPVKIDDARVKDADHGLRSADGVGGPSLAERVNLGAQILASS